LQKIKLVLAIRSLNIGGAERQFIELVKNIDKNIFDILVITMYGGVQENEISCLKEIRYINLEKKGRFDIKSYFKYKKFLKQFNPDVIYSFLGEMNLFSYWAKPKNTKLIWGLRASDTNMAKYGKVSEFLFNLQKKYSKNIDKIISNSNKAILTHKEYGFFMDRAVVVYNGIDVNRFKKIKEKNNKKIVIGMASRFDVIKGYDIFAKALNKLFKEFDIEVKIAGDGDKKIKNDFLNILEYDVELLGDISDIERFYNDIDILISASYMEGFSNSIAEAMACEVACVVTDVGDSKVIVGDTGIVVKPNEEELYKGIKTMLNLDYKSLGKKARQRVIENFSIEKMINNTQKEILKCVE